MSTKTKKVVDSEERLDTIVGIVTVLATLALIAWLFISMSIKGSALSAVAYDGEIRRGSEQTFTASVKSPKIKDGETVKWLVNGQVVNEDVYHAESNEPLTLNYALKTNGRNQVTVKVGKYSQSAVVDVLPPLLTISAPNVTVVYGEDLPEFNYDCKGFVEDDTRDMMEYEGTCRLCDSNDVELTYGTNCGSASKLNVGVYKLNLDQSCRFKDYEVNYASGTLTVLPKKLSVENSFVKKYDSTNVIENPEITLTGIEEGDEVIAKTDKLYFDNKNAGKDKTVMLANVELEGDSSRNYVLEGVARGTILPKEVEISGLVIRDKMFDGTTRAQIDKMGALDGVCAGDSVAIGNLELSFAEAYAGEQQIVLDNVSLVGADKDNYTVTGVDVASANINTTIWNKIFVKNPVVGA